MNKFYEKLPKSVFEILLVSDGWLIGSSIEKLLNDEIPNDYDIIYSQSKRIQTFAHTNKSFHSFNHYGGEKLILNGTIVDVWICELSDYLKTAKKITFAYNATRDILIRLA